MLEEDPRPMQTYGCGQLTISLAWCTPPKALQDQGHQACHYRYIMLDKAFAPDPTIFSFSKDQLFTALRSERGKFGRCPGWTLFQLSQENPECADQLIQEMKQPPFQPCIEYGKFRKQPKPPKGKSIFDYFTILFSSLLIITLLLPL